MIKTTIVANTKEDKFINYPVIAIGRKSLAVIAFNSENSGVVLSQGLTRMTEFKEYKNLISIFNPDWKILNSNDQVILKNK